MDARLLLDEQKDRSETLAGLLDKSALIALSDQRVIVHPLTRFFVCP